MDMKHLHSTDKIKTKKNEKKTTHEIHVKKDTCIWTKQWDDKPKKSIFEPDHDGTSNKRPNENLHLNETMRQQTQVYFNQTMTEQATSDRNKRTISNNDESEYNSSKTNLSTKKPASCHFLSN